MSVVTTIARRRLKIKVIGQGQWCIGQSSILHHAKRLDDGSAPEEVTANGVNGSGGGGAAPATKPSAKLQFAKLLRGTVASAASTSPTSAGAPAAATTNAASAPSGDSSPSARPPSRTATKTTGSPYPHSFHFILLQQSGHRIRTGRKNFFSGRTLSMTFFQGGACHWQGPLYPSHPFRSRLPSPFLRSRPP